MRLVPPLGDVSMARGGGELRAVVRENGGEQHAERDVPGRAPHPVERVGDVLRALPRHGPCEHEALPREHDHRQDALVAPAALHRVGLRDLHARSLASAAVDARVEPASVERLGRLHAAVHGLALDRRAGNPRLAPDLRERLAPAPGGFRRKALVVRQVLVLLLLDCHLGILSLLRRGGIAASAEERMPCFARKRKWASGPARLSGQVSMSPLPTYLCNRHTPQKKRT